MDSLPELSRQIRELPTTLLESFVMPEQFTLTMRALLKRVTELWETVVLWSALESYMLTGRVRKSCSTRTISGRQDSAISYWTVRECLHFRN